MQPETTQIFNYMHKHFNIETPRGPFCFPHTILSHTEVRQVILHDLKVNPLALGKIYVDDPQAIWIGATVGDIVKIVSYSPLVGESVKYRVVSQRTGKVTATAKKARPPKPEEPPTADEDAVGDEYQQEQEERVAQPERE